MKGGREYKQIARIVGKVVLEIVSIYKKPFRLMIGGCNGE
jgi:hypothetical protein